MYDTYIWKFEVCHFSITSECSAERDQYFIFYLQVYAHSYINLGPRQVLKHSSYSTPNLEILDGVKNSQIKQSQAYWYPRV